MAHPLVRCEGRPRDRGVAHGEAARELVHENIQTYRMLLQRRFGVAWPAARRHAAAFVPKIRAFDRGLAEEIAGIADGARADVRDIVLLNARSSLTLTDSPDGCTTFVSIPDGDRPGAALLAQNWDNLTRLRAVVLDIREADTPGILTLTEAGTLGKIGLNTEGVGIAVNGLHSRRPAARGVPLFVAIRKALAAPTLVEALRIMSTTPKDGPHHYMVASRGGVAFSIEALPSEFDLLRPAGPFLVHTNHYLSPRFVVRPECRLREPGSVVRLSRAERLLAAHRGPIGVAEAKDVLSDHSDAPASICSHATAGADELAGETKCAVIMELGAGRMHVSEAHPCKTGLETFAFA
jgi:isopenicillin-N N-acyltransferase-like protein